MPDADEKDVVADTPTPPDSLFEALRRFQADPPHVAKTEKAKVKTRKKDGSAGPEYTYDYVSLAVLMEKVLPALSELGLVWITKPVVLDQRPALAYKMVFPASGEEDGGVMPLMLAQGGPQDLGSAITYGRRYALISYLGLAPDKDEDAADAQKTATAPKPKKVTKPYAQKIVKAAMVVGVLDRLSLAAGHVLHEDVGPTESEAEAVAALMKLDSDQASKVEEWVAKKQQEALDA